MAATNYYFGLSRGADNQAYKVTIGTSSTATLTVELRVQTNDGTNPTGITKEEVKLLTDTIMQAILDNVNSGTDMPVL